MATYTAQSREPGRAELPINSRPDRWWIEPLWMASVLVLFGIYAAWRSFENRHFEANGMTGVFTYVSPFYSPPIHHWFPNWFTQISPALFLVVFPASFRGTCYYCRRVYYRSFFQNPPACAAAGLVGNKINPQTSRGKYTGETKFPFSINNLHRYALYAILIVVAFHWYHLFEAFQYINKDGTKSFGFGVGAIVFGLDTVMLSLYVFSCHSWRHLVGGGINKFSSAKNRHNMWKKVTHLNEKHGLYFWLSLATVWAADLYVKLVYSGTIPDIKFF